MNERGTAAVEFALVLPLVLLATLALIQVVAIGRDAIVVSHAAREGAREAAVSPDDAEVEAAVARSGLTEERTEVEVERGPGVGDPVLVRVSYATPVVLPLAGWLFPSDVVLSRSATMRQEVAHG